VRVIARMRRPANGSEPADPVQANGTIPAGSDAAGWTLLANQTYYAQLGGLDASHVSYHAIFETAGMIVTSVTLEDCNFPEAIVGPLSETVGQWIPETPDDGDIEVVGNCAQADGVVSKTAGAAGGAMAHYSGVGSLRARLRIVMGATGGVARFAAHGKD
jgi:hypothetical protein